MKRLVAVMAFLSSLASLLVIAGGGLTLLAIENSGERGMGALLALGSAIAFAAVMALVFAREGAFGEGIRKAVAIGAAIIGAIPAAGLSFAAIRFAGLPFESRMPLVDWTVLAVGIAFGLGAISILALGHRRSQEGGQPPPMVHMQQIRHAQQQLRTAFEAAEPRPRAIEDHLRPLGVDEDDEIRVRRI